MYTLNMKLQILKTKLKILNKESFGNIQDNIEQSKSKLQMIQDTIASRGHCDSLADQEKEAQCKMDSALNSAEFFLKRQGKG